MSRRERIHPLVITALAVLSQFAASGCGSIYKTSMNESLEPAHVVWAERVGTTVDVQVAALDHLLLLDSQFGSLAGQERSGDEALARRRALQWQVDELLVAASEMRRTALAARDVEALTLEEIAAYDPLAESELRRRWQRWFSLNAAAADALQTAIDEGRQRIEAGVSGGVKASAAANAVVNWQRARNEAVAGIRTALTAGWLLQERIAGLPEELTPPWFALQASADDTERAWQDSNLQPSASKADALSN